MNRYKPYHYQILGVIKKLGVLLLLYSVCRVLFYAFNASYFNETPVYSLLKIFVFGVRFDFSAVVQFNIILFFLMLLPLPLARHKVYEKVLFIIFWVVNAFLLFLNFMDIEYFKYISKRSTADVFDFVTTGDDVIKLVPQFMLDFWYIPLLWILAVWAGIWLTRSKSHQEQPYKFNIVQPLLMLLLLGTLFTGARGIGVKPLRIISAARYANSQEIPLLINTPFSILHTIQQKDNIIRNYFPEQECRNLFSPLRQYSSSERKNDNVVILIMESFSHEFSGFLSGGKTYTPFLDSLLRHSLTFENGFANCRKSVEAIPAILAALPSMTNNSYISSHYAGNRLKALPYILGKYGYTTAFFHGGRNGTMSFDEFSKIAGIQRYFGMNEYDGPPAFDNNWGIYDYEFLEFVVRKTSTLPQPFFEAVFTLSSHHPYNVPRKFDSLIPGNEAPQLRAVRYADMALRNYFKRAMEQPWFRNTLFVIVADHTAKIVDRAYNNPVGTYRIPIAYYHPGNDSLKGRRKEITQQIDIMPSVIHYLGLKDRFLAYGNSVFDAGRKPFAVNYLNNLYYYFQDGFILTFDGEKSRSLYNYSTDKHLKINLIKTQKDTLLALENNLKAIIQDYSKRLDNNSLTNQ